MGNAGENSTLFQTSSTGYMDIKITYVGSIYSVDIYWVPVLISFERSQGGTMEITI